MKKKRISIKFKKPVSIKIKKPNFKKLFGKQFLKKASFVVLILFVLGFGLVVGVYKAIMQNLPDITQLEEFEPKIITYFYSSDGEVIGEYATEKRIEVKFSDLPDFLIKAIIATEDPRFYQHKGIDYL